MTRNQKIFVGVLVGALLVAAGVLAAVRSGDRGLEVRMDEVERRSLESTVTASGNIRPRRTVDISSDVSARVSALEVREGDDVEAEQVLVRLDPTQFEAALRRAQAALNQAEAQQAQMRANLIQARRNYDRLHALGFAHSVEAWLDDRLVGGLYGVAINSFFAGESMFSWERDASKVTLVHLVERLRSKEFLLLDIQFLTDHFRQFGAVEIPRRDYKQLLARALQKANDFS